MVVAAADVSVSVVVEAAGVTIREQALEIWLGWKVATKGGKVGAARLTYSVTVSGVIVLVVVTVPVTYAYCHAIVVHVVVEGGWIVMLVTVVVIGNVEKTVVVDVVCGSVVVTVAWLAWLMIDVAVTIGWM